MPKAQLMTTENLETALEYLKDSAGAFGEDLILVGDNHAYLNYETGECFILITRAPTSAELKDIQSHLDDAAEESQS